MAIDNFHLVCGICSVLCFIASALLIWREHHSQDPPSQLHYALPRVMLVCSFCLCIESAALVALSLLDATSDPYFEHVYTVISDVAGDILTLSGAAARQSRVMLPLRIHCIITQHLNYEIHIGPFAQYH